MAPCLPAESASRIESGAEGKVAAADFAAIDFTSIDFTSIDFTSIVRRHQSMVFSIALHFLLDRLAAEELAQDVFLQLHAALPKLKSEDHLKFWLRRVTAHRCIDQKRRRKLAQVSLEEAGEIAEARNGERGGWDDPLLARRLQQVVASLPEKQRLVVILRFQEDLGADEIAEVLAMPVATVKSHLQRALAMLREKISRAIGDVSL
jgi:RNA polymerase sigma-70 factor, ECF subfamily